MKQLVSKQVRGENPFLTIITRSYKRPIGMSKNLESIEALTDKDIEQIFIHDEVGVGMLEANRSFSDPSVTELIKGQYVFLLDDDDFIVNPNMVNLLKSVAFTENAPDIIFFRMIIKNGMNNNYYPTDELCWGKEPIIARIGGSCMVVKTDWFKKYIHHFGVQRCGDYQFLKAMWNNSPSAYWLDVLMCETGSVGGGKPE